MSNLRRLAQSVRHLPGLERAEWLWSALRPLYHRVLAAPGRGVEVRVGNQATIRMPVKFCGGDWERYEPESIGAFRRWLEASARPVVLDVGSSVGIYSAVALFARPEATAIAFDSDLASLAATRDMCAYAPGGRLELVHGLLADRSTVPATLAQALRSTGDALARHGAQPGATRYIGLRDAEAASIPHRQLDELFEGFAWEGRPALVKCDVEGAEIHVLRGAESLLRRVRPWLLLSVHPQELPQYGSSREQVHALVAGHGYSIRVLAVDHEEHWWCTPS